MKIEELKEEIKNISEPKVSSKSVPFLSQFFLKKVSEKSHGENAVLIRYAPQKITVQFVTHLLSGIEFSGLMWYNVLAIRYLFE